MGKYSKIAWCHHTFNCWWGCTRVSEACRNCYAETWAKRTGFDVWGPYGKRRFFGQKHWNKPLKWDSEAEKAGIRYRVFCASMCDVFEDLPSDHPDRNQMIEERRKLWNLIENTPNLDWLLLTKRPENILKMVPSLWAQQELPHNIWVGATAEDQETFNWIIVGGESGGGSRNMPEDWPRNIMTQCKNKGVAFFMKQMGTI